MQAEYRGEDFLQGLMCHDILPTAHLGKVVFFEPLAVKIFTLPSAFSAGTRPLEKDAVR